MVSTPLVINIDTKSIQSNKNSGTYSPGNIFILELFTSLDNYIARDILYFNGYEVNLVTN